MNPIAADQASKLPVDNHARTPDAARQFEETLAAVTQQPTSTTSSPSQQRADAQGETQREPFARLHAAKDARVAHGRFAAARSAPGNATADAPRAQTNSQSPPKASALLGAPKRATGLTRAAAALPPEAGESLQQSQGAPGRPGAAAPAAPQKTTPASPGADNRGTPASAPTEHASTRPPRPPRQERGAESTAPAQHSAAANASEPSRGSQPSAQRAAATPATAAGLPPAHETAEPGGRHASTSQLAAGTPTNEVASAKHPSLLRHAEGAATPAKTATPLNEVPQWLAEKVSQSASRAHLRLDPPELGELSLVVRVREGRVFLTATGDTRAAEALYARQAAIEEALGEQGLTLKSMRFLRRDEQREDATRRQQQNAKQRQRGRGKPFSFSVFT